MENKDNYLKNRYRITDDQTEVENLNIIRKVEIKLNEESVKELVLNKYSKESYGMATIYFGMNGSSLIGDKEEASCKIKEDPLCLYSSEEYKSNIYQSLTREKLREAVDYVFKHNQYNSTTL